MSAASGTRETAPSVLHPPIPCRLTIRQYQTNPLTAAGRLGPLLANSPHSLKYHDLGREKTCAPSVGQWSMISKKMINGGTIDSWTCLNFSRIPPEEVQRFCMDLTHMCNANGMDVNQHPFVEVMSAAPNHIENALRDVHRRATQMIAQQGTGNQLQLLIVILPEVSGLYGKIKRVCETDIGIVRQGYLPKHASRTNKQHLENVVLKINVKVGGSNSVLDRDFGGRNGISYVSGVPTIICGADVTHPPPGEDSASSIAAETISVDNDLRSMTTQELIVSKTKQILELF